MRVFFVSLLLTLFFIFPAFAETSVVDLALSKGIKQCEKPLRQVANQLVKQKDHGSHGSWYQEQPDKRLFDSLTIVSYIDGDTHLSITAAPNQEGGCDINYVETIVLSTTCQTAQNTTFANWTFAKKLHNKTVVLQDSEGKVSVYLTPQVNDAICMVTKRQTIYQ